MHDAPRTLVIRSAGANCDAEMVRAFELAGSRVDLAHVEALIARPADIASCDIIGFPGGFSYGDDIASGRVMALKLAKLYPQLRDAAERAVPMIGVCNGFQALVQLGFLPGPAPDASGAVRWPVLPPRQTAALTDNAGARFIDRWARVAVEPASPCIWTRDLASPALPDDLREAVMILPLASGEGRFVPESDAELARIEASNLVALRYLDNYNGSTAAIAGVCDPSGLIFGLMPHPDRYLDWTLHPSWTRLPSEARAGDTPGLRLFRNAVDHVARVTA